MILALFPEVVLVLYSHLYLPNFQLSFKYITKFKIVCTCVIKPGLDDKFIAGKDFFFFFKSYH